MSAKKSASSAATAASLSASSLSKAASLAAASASATTSAKAADAYNDARGMSTASIVILTMTITTTLIAGILAAIYYSGYADDILEAMAKKYYSAKAQTEAAAMGKIGNEKAQSFLKGKIFKSPRLQYQGRVTDVL